METACESRRGEGDFVEVNSANSLAEYGAAATFNGKVTNWGLQTITHTANRWKGDRKVTDLKRHRGQDAVVHYLYLRTQRTGNAPLRQVANSDSAVAAVQH